MSAPPAGPTRRGSPRFYPADAKPTDFLAHYAQHFRAVELNTTGYRLPAEEQFERWAAQTPAGFQFAPKLNAFRSTDVGTFEERVRRLGRATGPGPRPHRLRPGRGPPLVAARLSRPGATDRLRLPARILGRDRDRAPLERGPGRRPRGQRSLPLPAPPRAPVRRRARSADGPTGCAPSSPTASTSMSSSSTRRSRARPGTRSACSSSSPTDC